MKERIIEDMKIALKTGQKERLSAIRLILAAIKQKEVDERKELNETDIIRILSKLARQRNESITQFNAAGRDDLSAKEQAELDIIREYLPEPLDEQTIDKLINEAATQTQADSIRDMGKVMKILQPQLQGRANIENICKKVRYILSNNT